MSEHEPSAYGTRRFGLEQLSIVAFLLVGLAILGALIWLASQA